MSILVFSVSAGAADDEKLRVCVLGDAGKNVLQSGAGPGVQLVELSIADAKGRVKPESLAKALKASADCRILYLSWNGPFEKAWAPVRKALAKSSELGRLIVAPATDAADPSKTVAGGEPNVFLFGRAPEDAAALTVRLMNEYPKRPPALWRGFLAERKSRGLVKTATPDDVFK